MQFETLGHTEVYHKLGNIENTDYSIAKVTPIVTKLKYHYHWQ